MKKLFILLVLLAIAMPASGWAEERAALSAHLEQCEHCRRYRDAVDAIRAALREEMRTARLTALLPNDAPGAAFEEVARNDAEDDAAVLDFINSLA